MRNYLSYDEYMRTLDQWIDGEIQNFKDKQLWPIRELYAQLKIEKTNLRGLLPHEKNRRKILNRYKAHRLSLSSQRYKREYFF